MGFGRSFRALFRRRQSSVCRPSGSRVDTRSRLSAALRRFRPPGRLSARGLSFDCGSVSVFRGFDNIRVLRASRSGEDSANFEPNRGFDCD